MRGERGGVQEGFRRWGSGGFVGRCDRVDHEGQGELSGGAVESREMWKGENREGGEGDGIAGSGRDHRRGGERQRKGEEQGGVAAEGVVWWEQWVCGEGRAVRLFAESTTVCLSSGICLDSGMLQN